MNRLCLLFICIFTIINQTIAQSSISKNQSPYFFVESSLSNIEQFPLLGTKVKSTIIGPMADVTVIQSYHNKGTKAIDVKYVFPASTRAAVYAMTMRIGNREVKADIQTKKKAKALYETAKKEGKHASLLSEELPNVFEMSIANIMPGDIIEVEMKYTEFIIPSDQLYEWVFPTVVGPRFSGENKKESFSKQAYTQSKVAPTSALEIAVEIETSVPIQYAKSPTHKVLKNESNDQHCYIRLRKEEKFGGNKDFVLHYSLADQKINTGVLVHHVGDEKFFLCQVEPPHRMASPTIVPREYIFVMDISGSMNGKPLEIAKELMKNLLNDLSENDKFNILTFAGSAGMLFPESQFVSAQGIREALSRIENLEGGGGTDILRAINKALETPKNVGYSRSFVIITDGYVDVDEKVFEMIQKNLDEANFFSFGIGTSVNRNIIEGIAHVGGGEPFIITDFKYAKTQADRLKKYIEMPLLTDIEISGKNIELFDVIPEKTPDLMADRPIYYFGKFKNAQESASLKISGIQGNKTFQKTLNISTKANSIPLLKYLWAREKIRFLGDFNHVNHSEFRVKEITRLGLKYSLLTKYTSFVAIDNRIVNQNGESHKIKTPLPMPADISNHAIGMEMSFEHIHNDGEKEKTNIQIEVITGFEGFDVIIETLLQEFIKTLGRSELNELIKTGKSIEFRKGEIISTIINPTLIALREYFGTTFDTLGIELTQIDFIIEISE